MRDTIAHWRSVSLAGRVRERCTNTQTPHFKRSSYHTGVAFFFGEHRDFLVFKGTRLNAAVIVHIHFVSNRVRIVLVMFVVEAHAFDRVFFLLSMMND